MTSYREFGCEPLRVWNRLEPRPRRAEFDEVLRAEIRDPQWMLARQWQFGEFFGEDTGSPIFAKLMARQTRITEVALDGTFADYTDAIPLEVQVEQAPIHLDLKMRAQLGRLCGSIITQHADTWNLAGHPPVDLAALLSALRGEYPISLPQEGGPQHLEAQRLRSNPRAFAFARALAGRATDGAALRAALGTTPITPLALAAHVHPDHHDLVAAALIEFAHAYDALYAQPEPGADSAWVDDQLEYQFQCQVPRVEGGQQQLSVREYASGHLDWYSFDLDQRTPDAPPDAVSTHVVSMIPTSVEFPGMPNSRFWTFEDGAVDLGQIKAASTDLAKIIVAEFALLYGNNWFVMPYRQPVGTLTEIEGIVITDVFGARTLVRSATRGDPADAWTRWDLFQLSEPPGDALAPAHLFLPPTLGKVHESAPIEQVQLLRDELSNMVWGVEARVADPRGGSRDGHQAARRLTAALGLHQERIDPIESAELRYSLGNTIPENWIPFIPVHVPGSNRAIQLQRAAMPRFQASTTEPVRPQTQILRPGMNPDDTQAQPYFIHEEEVPRAGVTVESSYQRTRWYDGRTFVWLGRRKRAGRGEGSAGLRFDEIEDLTQKP
jgi:hypothetical protein